MSDASLRVVLLGQDRGAKRVLNEVGDAAGKSDHALKGMGAGLVELGTRMSKVMTFASAAGPAVLALGSAASATASGVTALAGAVGPGIVAAGVAVAGSAAAIAQGALVTKFALHGMSEALQGNAKAMKALTPQGRAMVTLLHGFVPQIQKIRSSVQEHMFDGMTNPIRQLAGSYLPRFSVAANLTAVRINRLGKETAKILAQPFWKSSFTRITSVMAKNFYSLGQAGLQLAQAVLPIGVAALPLTRAFSQWALGAAKAVNASIQAAYAAGKIQAFFAKAGVVGAQLGRILGDVAVGLFNVFKIGGAQSGGSLLNTVERIAQGFRDWTTSTSGMGKINQFFIDGHRNLQAMGRLIGSVTKGLSGLGSGQQLAPLIDQINREVIPPLMTFLHNASASGALSSLVSAVAGVVGVFAQLSASDSSLTAFSKTLGALAKAAGWIVSNVPGAGAALGAFFTVAGAATALKFAGLGPVVDAVGKGMLTLATRLGVAIGAETTETGAITANTIVRQLSRTTLGTWLGVKALEMGAWIRTTAATVASTAATVASTVVQKVAAGASKAWAAAQWLLNAALDANPIGLVVLAIAALVAGFVIAWKHSQTFRSIVTGVFDGIKNAVTAMWDVIRPVFKAWVDVWLGVVGAIVNGAAKAFGWVPYLGPKLHDAAAAFNSFRDKVNATLSGINDKTVKVNVVAQGSVQLGDGAPSQGPRHMGSAKPTHPTHTPSTGVGGHSMLAPRVATGPGPDVAARAGADMVAAFHKGAHNTAKVSLLTDDGVKLVSSFISGTKSQKTKLGDALKSIRDQVKQAKQQLADDTKSFEQSFDSFSSSVFGADYGTDSSGNALPPTVSAILAKAQQEQAKSAALAENVKKLVGLGLNGDLLQQLQGAGQSGVAEINTLASGATASDIASLNTMNTATYTNDRAAGMTAAGVVTKNSPLGGTLFDDATQQSLAEKIAAELAKVDLGGNTVLQLDGKTINASVAKTNRKQGHHKK